MGKTNYEETAAVFKPFGDTNRLRILDMLREGEICATELLEQLNISQSTLSHHMKILCDSGAVVPRREGKWTYYSIDREGSRKAVRLLEELLTVSDSAETKQEEASAPSRRYWML